MLELKLAGAQEEAGKTRVTAALGYHESGYSRIERRVSRAANWLLDLIFPPTCANCGRLDFRFCASCLRELEGAPIVAAAWRVDGLDEMRATGKHDQILRIAVGAFKYQGATELTAPLAARLITTLRTGNWRIDAIAPVPLFADREAERGYNQSALLSQNLASETGFRFRGDWLWRVRDTSQQARLSPNDRRENVKDAFAAAADVRGLSILLVDDVVTTGSTLRECAIALRAKGASAVYGIAVSHA